MLLSLRKIGLASLFKEVRVFKGGPFQKSPFSRDSRELRDSGAQTGENKGDSNSFLDIPENLEILVEILDTPTMQRPLS